MSCDEGPYRCRVSCRDLSRVLDLEKGEREREREPENKGEDEGEGEDKVGVED